MKNQIHLFCTAAIIAVSATAFAQNAIGFGSQTTKNSELITQNSLKGSGMCFTPNKGQIADMNGNLRPDILYKGDGGGADVYLRKTGISYVTSNMGEVMSEIDKEVELRKFDQQFSQQQVDELKRQLEAKALIKIQRTDVDFEGSNPNPQTLNQEEVEGYTNYYYAHCPNGITNVKSYNRVVQKNIYTGIDVIYYGGKEKGLKYDIVINPGANPKDIKLNYTGAKVKLSGSKLIVQSELGETVETLPKVYQNINGKIVDVGCEYKIANSDQRLGNREKQTAPNGYSLMAIGSIVTFELGTYNHELPLIIDPWATYFGGNKLDIGSGITNDNAGNVLVTGNSMSVNFPVTTGAFQTIFAGATFGGDAFVVKFNSSGSLQWSTFYGGNNLDIGNEITKDLADNVIIIGNTMSANFPVTTGAFQTVYRGGSINGGDVFIVKFNSAGIRQWATLDGGSLDDFGCSIIADATGNIFITGITYSSDFPITSGAFQMTFGSGTYDAFVAKFDIAGACLWSTFCGGNNFDRGNGITVDAGNNVLITGYTGSTNFPVTTGAAFGGVYDVFVVKFNSAGTLLWASFYGGGGQDMGSSIVTDNVNNIFVSGRAQTNFPVTPGAFQTTWGGSWDALLMKINTSGAILWATFYGLSAMDYGKGVAIDGNNNVYLYMETEDNPSPSLVDACSYQPIFNGGSTTNPSGGYTEDQTIVKFTSAGVKLCATYMGGNGEDDIDSGGNGITIFGNSIYITGGTDGGYPVTAGAFQTNFGGPSASYYSGGTDVFIASLCINICEGKTLGLNYSATTQSVCTNAPVKFTPSVTNSCDTTGYKFHWVFTGGTPAVSDSVSPTVKYAGAGNYDVKLVVTTLCKKDSITKTNYITVNNCGCALNAQFTKGTANCPTCGCKEWIMVTGINGTPPYTYQWPDGYDKRYKNSLCPGEYNVIVTDNNGCKTTVKINAP